MPEIEFDEDGNAIDANGPKALRDALKKKAKENKELVERITALENRARSSNLQDVIAARGMDARVSKFYPSDRATDLASVEDWIAENREIFGFKEAVIEESPNTLSAVELEGYGIIKKIQAAEAATEMDFKSRLAACNSQEEVIALMAQFEASHTF